MHALMGVGASKYTFTGRIMLGNTPTTSLIDSGNTATFITPNMAESINVC